MVRIILDTGVFFRPERLVELSTRPEDVIVPVVALAERVRQLARDGRDVDAFLRALDATEIYAEPLLADAACAFVARIRDDTVWRRHSRDALIAAHVRPGDELWTTNPRDFLALGLPRASIVPVP